MFNGFVGRGFALVIAAATVGAATPAPAATITDGAPLAKGVALDLSGIAACGSNGGFATNLGSFSGSGGPGSGAAACGDRTTVQVKDDGTPFPYGRFNPNGRSWIDSNDLPRVVWNLSSPVAVTGLSFALTDAHDQADSHFEMSVGGATFSIPTREANGALHWISILFNTPAKTAKITFDTRLNDGYGIADVKVAPVPLPPALALIASGLAAIAALRRRRNAHAA